MAESNQIIAFMAQVNDNDDPTPASMQRAPSENMAAPQNLAQQFDENGQIIQKHTQISTPAYYETPLFIGMALFAVLLVVFIGFLKLRQRRKTK